MLRIVWFLLTGWWLTLDENVQVEVLDEFEVNEYGVLLLVERTEDNSRWFVYGPLGQVGDKFYISTKRLHSTSTGAIFSER